MPSTSTKAFALAALATVTALAQPALAEALLYSAELNGAAQVPRVETAATGMAEITLETETMTIAWMTSYEGLSGDLTGAHFHGPATREENAAPVVDILAHLEEGSAVLTADQMEEFQAGLFYINLHTAEHPDGEIRGQVVTAAQ